MGQTSQKPSQSMELITNFLQHFQNTLCAALEDLDQQATFKEDKWSKASLGQGRSRVLENGGFFEQAGVNYSHIHLNHVPQALLGHKPELEGQSCQGAGVSMVLHPKNPYCPTAHLNYRYFEAGDTWWFGGGADLTPYYAFEEDCINWHQIHKNAMDAFDPNYYPAFKYWADEYFYNHHRGETRGIGGTFYDYLDGSDSLLVKPDFARSSEQKNHPAQSLKAHPQNWESLFAMHQKNADAFLEAYLPIAHKRKNTPFTKQQRDFQLYRRGRYVEFNLLYDRGTIFGLKSGGRIESILMSLPPLVRWQYNYKAKPGTPEAQLTEKFLHRGISWHEGLATSLSAQT